MAAQVSSVIPGPLTVSWYVPSMATVPWLWIKPADIEYDRAYRTNGAAGSGLEVVNFDMILVVSDADDQASQVQLDQYIHGSGALSVKAALEAGRTQYGGSGFSGTLDDLWVSKVEAYNYYALGGTQFLGATFRVIVIGRGDI